MIAIRRIGQLLLVLFFITFGVTLLMRLLPGDAASTLFPFGTPEQLTEIRAQLGTDKNVFAYYFDWLGNFLRGDLGFYYAATFGDAVTVTSMLAQTAPRTLLIMVYTMTFAIAVSIPLGVFLGYKAGSRIDKIISSSLFTISSIPQFAFGLGLAYLVAMTLNLVNPTGYVPLAEGLGEHFKSIVLPVFSLSFTLISTFTRLLRADVISTLREDFVTMASSKGLSNRWILFRHVLRPSSLTILTIAAINLGALIGGAVIIETIFALNGVGMFLVASIAQRQYLAVQSLVALTAIVFVTANVLVDLLYSVLDPRVRAQHGA
ncbi:MAG: ABC transporter permease [Ilumatobacteraceae bacterium]|nr:ABC transporter permease [Ilumatobacteraceae bacterium]